MSRWYESVDLPLRELGDSEGERLPESLPEVIDAHVHLFPDRLFEAVWRWFEKHAWPIRYKLRAPAVIEFLRARGVKRLVALHYAHKAGIARSMNAHMAELCRAYPEVVGLATVLPGEPDARAILEEAFDAGLKGVKLHCHVQCLSPDAEALHEVYETCASRGLPVVIHAGREPAFPQYGCDPYRLCAAERIERVLRDWPTLRICVPHFGADEFEPYERLLERYDNLWLDTTMAVSDYFPAKTPERFFHVRPERVLYGTDFPNLPFAWDREIKRIAVMKLKDEALERVLSGSARELYRIL